MVMSGSLPLQLLIQKIHLLQLLEVEEWDAIARLSWGIKAALADAFLGLWLRDHPAASSALGVCSLHSL